jgi:hypothetical protein
MTKEMANEQQPDVEAEMGTDGKPAGGDRRWRVPPEEYSPSGPGGTDQHTFPVGGPTLRGSGFVGKEEEGAAIIEEEGEEEGQEKGYLSHLYLAHEGERVAGWPIVQEGLEKCKSQASDATQAEHAFELLKDRHWDTFILWKSGRKDPVGFLMCCVGVYEDGQRYVSVPYLYVQPGHLKPVVAACMRDLKLYAVIHQCSRIVFKTERGATAFARILKGEGFFHTYTELMSWV